MTTTRHPFDPPIDPGLYCEHCGDKLLATAQLFDGGPTLSGLRQYDWTHAHGSPQCRIVRTARPYDGWRATTAVEAVKAERAAAEDALLDSAEWTVEDPLAIAALAKSGVTVHTEVLLPSGRILTAGEANRLIADYPNKPTSPIDR